ncbi:DUF721 domain-containing protein [bacterium]|nr:DUF721 domain-containing protein [bacterium]
MSEPKQIGGLIKKVLDELGIWDDIQENRIFLEWEKLVGEKIAKYVQPVRFIPETSELWLSAKDPVWRSQLFNIRGALLDSINEKIGAKTIKKIRIV